jgi:hypothetical protein
MPQPDAQLKRFLPKGGLTPPRRLRDLRERGSVLGVPLQLRNVSFRPFPARTLLSVAVRALCPLGHYRSPYHWRCGGYPIQVEAVEVDRGPKQSRSNRQLSASAVTAGGRRLR